MAGEWLDKIFSPVRQELVARLGTAYTNATGDYTTILGQQVTAGRFSQPGATTQLVIRAAVAFESATGGTFALTCNGTTIEVSAKPGGGGGTGTGTVQVRAAAATTGQISIGRVLDEATIDQVWIMPEGSGIVASDTDYYGWVFETFLPDGTVDGTIVNGVSSQTVGAGGLGTLDAYASTEIAPDTPGIQVSAKGSIVVSLSSVGTPTALPAVVYGCDYTIAGGGGGSAGILHAALTLSIAVPLGTYTATLTGKALGGGTITIDPGDAEPGGATIEVTEYAT